MRRYGALAFTLLCLAHVNPIRAQSLATWLEAGAGESRWSSTAATSASLRYGMIGLRAEIDPPGLLAAHGRGALGLGGDGNGAAGWWNGEAGVSIDHRGHPVRVHVAASVWGLGYRQGWRYTAAGARLAPMISWQRGGWLIRGRGEVNAGGWSQQTVVLAGPPVVVPAPVTFPASELRRESGKLLLAGGAVDLIHARGPVWLRVSPAGYRGSGRAHDAWQSVVEGELGIASGSVTLSSGVRWFAIHQATESRPPRAVAVRLHARVALFDDWAVTLNADTRPWDPLHGVLRGTYAQLGVEWRWLARPLEPRSLATLGAWTGEGRAVRFRLPAHGATSVELLGSFTAWQPIAMRRTAAGWEANLVLPAGTHQFGFLVDGEWHVPGDAPGSVEDGWNRRNATITIPERSR